MIANAILESAKNRILPDSTVLNDIKKALIDFKEPKEEDCLPGDGNVFLYPIRKHPVTEVENYFHYVTVTGQPSFEWSIIRPAFLWKLKHCLHDMVRIDTEICESSKNKESDTPKEKPDLEDGDSELRQMYDFIIKKAEDLDGTPFTFQRICELLDHPTRHYIRAEKYFRAMDKCINVVTTITPEGRRITGVEDLPISCSDTGRIEQRFFGKVDEVDGDLWESSTTAVIGPKFPLDLSGVEDKPLDMSQKAKKSEETSSGEMKSDESVSNGETQTKEQSEKEKEREGEKKTEENGSEATNGHHSVKRDHEEDGSGDATMVPEIKKVKEEKEEEGESMETEETQTVQGEKGESVAAEEDSSTSDNTNSSDTPKMEE